MIMMVMEFGGHVTCYLGRGMEFWDLGPVVTIGFCAIGRNPSAGDRQILRRLRFLMIGTGRVTSWGMIFGSVRVGSEWHFFVRFVGPGVQAHSWTSVFHGGGDCNEIAEVFFYNYF
jgi:hypothetical protein